MKTPKLTLPTILVIAGIILIIIAVAAYAVTSITVPTQGTVNATANITANPASINWGTINAGDTTPVSRLIQLTNTGGQPTAPLTMAAASTVGEVTWNGAGAVIGAGQSQTFTVTLTPSASPPSGSFSFDITVTG